MILLRYDILSSHRSITITLTYQNNTQIGVHENVQLVMIVLGIVKARCAFLPIDPFNPKARIRSLLDEAKPAYVLPSFQPLIFKTQGAQVSHSIDVKNAIQVIEFML